MGILSVMKDKPRLSNGDVKKCPNCHQETLTHEFDAFQLKESEYGGYTVHITVYRCDFCDTYQVESVK